MDINQWMCEIVEAVVRRGKKVDAHNGCSQGSYRKRDPRSYKGHPEYSVNI